MKFTGCVKCTEKDVLFKEMFANGLKIISLTSKRHRLYGKDKVPKPVTRKEGHADSFVKYERTFDC